MSDPENPSEPVSRERLYEEVWTTPVLTLAKRYGLSDRGLGKLCAREAIPVPPRGYWAKIRAGKKLKRPPLPPAPEPTPRRHTQEHGLAALKPAPEGAEPSRPKMAATSRRAAPPRKQRALRAPRRRQRGRPP